MLVDDTANFWKLQFYDSAAATWKDIITFKTEIQKITQDLPVRKDTPALSLIGTESGGKQYDVRESAGRCIIRNVTDAHDELVIDPASRVTVRLNLTAAGVALEAHRARHQIGGADAFAADTLALEWSKAEYKPGSGVSVGAGASVTIGEGFWLVNCAANTRVEAYDDVAAAWVTVIAAGGKGFVVSDGTNCRLFNAGAAAETSNLREIG